LKKQMVFDLANVDRKRLRVRQLVPNGYDGTAEMADTVPPPTEAIKFADQLQPADVVTGLPHPNGERLPITVTAAERTAGTWQMLADADSDLVQCVLGNRTNLAKVSR
jgi:hypothetical protein